MRDLAIRPYGLRVFGGSVRGGGGRHTASARSRANWRIGQISEPCDHFETDLRVGPPLKVCSACTEIGGTWVHLRQCLACGRTGCCDLSPNRHATGHYHETGHPMIRSAEPGEDWWWCYPDDRLYQAPGSMVGGGTAT